MEGNNGSGERNSVQSHRRVKSISKLRSGINALRRGSRDIGEAKDKKINGSGKILLTTAHSPIPSLDSVRSVGSFFGVDRDTTTSQRFFDSNLTVEDVWGENELVLMALVQENLFDARNEEVVFLSKLLKPKKDTHDNRGDMKQLLIVSKPKTKTKQANSTNSELVVNILNASNMSSKLCVPMLTLVMVDGDPALPFDIFERYPFKVKLEFRQHNKPLHVVSVMGSRQDKLILVATLLQLCEKLLDFRPATSNVRMSELRVVANDEAFHKRCPLLRSDGAGGEAGLTLSIFGNKLRSLGSRRNTSDSSDDEDVCTVDGANSNSTDDNLNEGNASAETTPSNSSLGVEGLLKRNEQEELWAIIQKEGFDGFSADRLAAKLDGRIAQLEEETTETLRQWENNASAGNAAAVDPVAELVVQLEQVFTELNGMDAWLAHDNTQVLRTMRKDIHKIEHENNRLQVKACNHAALRKHLAELLKRNAVSKDAKEILHNLLHVLHEDTRLEVECARASEGNSPAALRKLCNCARELADASEGWTGAESKLMKGKALSKDDDGSLNTINDFPEEPYLVAVHSLQAQVAQDINQYCMCVQTYLIERLSALREAYVAAFNKEIAARGGAGEYDADGGLPCFVRWNTAQWQFMPYGELVETLLLQAGSFDAVLHNYVQAMGDAYTAMFGTFFSLVIDRQVPEQDDNASFFREVATVVSSDSSSLENTLAVQEEAIAQEKKMAAVFTNRIVLDGQISNAVALRHCLAELVPVAVDEQAFLKGIFFWDQANDTAYTTSAALAAVATKAAEQGAPDLDNAEKLQRTLEFFFQRVSVFLDKLVPTNSLAQAVLCAVEVEKSILKMKADADAAGNPECRYWSNALQYFARRLDAFFNRFAERQLAWMETDLPTSFARFPRFVDKIVALWDRAVEHANETGGDALFNSLSEKFADNAVGQVLVTLADGLFALLEADATQPATRMRCACFYVATMPGRGGSALSGDKLETARAVLNQAKQILVDLLISYVLPELPAFVKEVDVLLKEVPTGELAFHKMRSDLSRVLLAITPETLERALAQLDATAQALTEEYAATGDGGDTISRQQHDYQQREFVTLVRGAVRDKIHEIYKRFLWIVEHCYGDLVMTSLADLEKLLEVQTQY